MKGVLVRDRVRALGLEPTPKLTWAVGRQMQLRYERELGALPPARRVPKTNSGGAHHMAVYPPDWSPIIDEVIRQVAAQQAAEPAREPSLFDGLGAP